jgi:hypothetical protein
MIMQYLYRREYGIDLVDLTFVKFSPFKYNFPSHTLAQERPLGVGKQRFLQFPFLKQELVSRNENY